VGYQESKKSSGTSSITNSVTPRNKYNFMAPKKFSVAGKPGSDPTLVKAPLTIGEVTYFLAFDFNALATAEELTGLNLLGSLDLQNLNVTRLRALVYSAMLKAQPEITLTDVGDLFAMSTTPEIVNALVHAWTGSRPEVVVDGAKDDKVNPPVEQPELPL
jgi:hypothetical protein